MTDKPQQPWRPGAGLLSTAAIVAGCVAFMTGRAGWFVLLCFVAAVVMPVVNWLRKSQAARSFRYPLLILSVPICVSLYEAWLYQTIPESVNESLDLAAAEGEPDLNFEYDLPGVMHSLFPESPDAVFARGLQMHQCMVNQDTGRDAEICRQFQTLEPEVILDYYRRAIRTGAKSNEALYYTCAELLIQSGASQAEIDEVVEVWKRNFPRSKFPDPRDVHAQK